MKPTLARLETARGRRDSGQPQVYVVNELSLRSQTQLSSSSHSEEQPRR